MINPVTLNEIRELLKQISAKNKSEDLSETSNKKRNNSEEGEVK